MKAHGAAASGSADIGCRGLAGGRGRAARLRARCGVTGEPGRVSRGAAWGRRARPLAAGAATAALGTADGDVALHSLPAQARALAPMGLPRRGKEGGRAGSRAKALTL